MIKNPKGQMIFGLAKVGEKGQIVIPKDARDIFGIKSGDYLLLLGDPKKGMALVKPDVLDGVTKDIFSDKEDK